MIHLVYSGEPRDTTPKRTITTWFNNYLSRRFERDVACEPSVFLMTPLMFVPPGLRYLASVLLWHLSWWPSLSWLCRWWGLLDLLLWSTSGTRTCRRHRMMKHSARVSQSSKSQLWRSKAQVLSAKKIRGVMRAMLVAEYLLINAYTVANEGIRERLVIIWLPPFAAGSVISRTVIYILGKQTHLEHRGYLCIQANDNELV